MRNAGLDEAQPGIKIAGRNISNFRYADDITFMAESKEELKGFLMKVKEKSENAGLKLNIQKTKVMASGPITSWHIDGKKVEIVTDFIFFSCKITADGDCSNEIRRRLLLGRKAIDKSTRCIKKQRYHFANKGPYSQSNGFSSDMYGSESWTIKKAEPLRIDIFELWCWRRLCRVCWIARR